MTEPERKKWQIGDSAGFGGTKCVYDDDDRLRAQCDDPADAARIVALHNAEGGDAECTRPLTRIASNDAAGGPYSGGNAGLESVAKHLRSALEDMVIHVTMGWEIDGPLETASKLLREPAAPVVPEPPAKVDWRVSAAEIWAKYHARAALARRSARPATPATPVIDETRELVERWTASKTEANLRPFRDGTLVQRLRTILAEHDAVIEWAEGRKA